MSLSFSPVNPPFLYGSLTPQLQSIIDSGKPNDYSLFSTTTNLYQLLFPQGTLTSSLLYASVEDVAKLHVLSLTGKPTSEVGRKRIVVANPHVIDWNNAIVTLKEQRPELVERLNTTHVDPPHPLPNLGYLRIEEVLGFKKSDFTPFEKVIVNAFHRFIGTIF
jgi:hypothetical protein